MYGLTSRQIHRRLAARYHPIGFRACREILNADDANGSRTSAYKSFYNTARTKDDMALYSCETSLSRKNCRTA
jgi:hypothetical protein